MRRSAALSGKVPRLPAPASKHRDDAGPNLSLAELHCLPGFEERLEAQALVLAGGRDGDLRAEDDDLGRLGERHAGATVGEDRLLRELRPFLRDDIRADLFAV